MTKHLDMKVHIGRTAYTLLITQSREWLYRTLAIKQLQPFVHKTRMYSNTVYNLDVMYKHVRSTTMNI